MPQHIENILIDYGQSNTIKYKNSENINKILNELITNGPKKLQIITDFDYTLTKHSTNNEKCSPALDIIRQNKLMPDELKIRARKRFDDLLAIETDPNLTINQKIPAVIQSFNDSFDDLVNSRCLTKTTFVEMIQNAKETCHVEFRDNCDNLFQLLNSNGIPVIIITGGIGNIVTHLLSMNDILLSNIHVIGNFMEFEDGKNGILTSFKSPLIHTFNKDKLIIPKYCEYSEAISTRSNAILLGDSIGDANMAKSLQQIKNVLKIGFLNELNDVQLNVFLDTFDIVILNDETMNFVNHLLKIICSN